MSKIFKGEAPPNSEPMDEFMIFNDSNWLSHMEGELLTLVESLGLRDSQERAIKSLIRQRLWDSFLDWGHRIKSEEYEEFLKKTAPTGKMGPVTM